MTIMHNQYWVLFDYFKGGKEDNSSRKGNL